MMRRALIDLAAIRQNVAALRDTVGDVSSMVVVKADGYGHGAVPVARAALEAGADWLGVVDIDEALELRTAGITAPVLCWLHGPDADFGSAIEAGIDLGVSSIAQLDAVVAAGRGSVQLKVDTGLGRNGAAASDWEPLFAAAAAHESAGRVVVRGLWSHLAGADDTAQATAFDTAISAAHAAGLSPQLVHLAASAAAISMPAARYGLVRFGISAYGLRAVGGGPALRPAMTLDAAVVSVKRVAAGTGVSYGHDHVTAGATTLALVPLGYADGVPRQASGRGPVSINGITYRVAGRVAMDQLVLDVGDDAVAVGDRAVLFGDPATGVPSADDWAEAAGTINYEIVTRIGHRVRREYLP
jgi:alanine racemase